MIRAFIKAVAAGALAGAWMPMIFTTMIALISLPNGFNGDGHLLGSLMLALSPVALTLAFVIPASLLIGLPTTFLLRKYQVESLSAYVTVGAIAGATLPVLVLFWMEAQDGWWMTLLGAFSGGITARTWFRCAREQNIC